MYKVNWNLYLEMWALCLMRVAFNISVMLSLSRGLVDGELMKAGRLETPSIEFMPLNYSLGRKKDLLLKYPTPWSASRNSE